MRSADHPVGSRVVYNGPDGPHHGTVLGYGQDAHGAFVSVYLDGWDGVERCWPDTLSECHAARHASDPEEK